MNSPSRIESKACGDTGEACGPVGAAPNGRASQALFFFRNFLRHPRMVGWLVPSSRYVVNSMLRNVDWASARVIVEYGPGLGTFTSRILERMRPDARLVAFEINPDFISFLKHSFHDPRLHLIEDSAEKADIVFRQLHITQADCVISGIPFRPIPHETRRAIVKRTHGLLKPGGKFLVYQFTDVVLPYLQESFGEVESDIEVLNLVPTRLFACERR